MFGLGSSSYPATFCAYGRLVDEKMSELGGTRMLPLRVGDEARGGLIRSFRAWMAEVSRELGIREEDGDRDGDRNGEKAQEPPAEWKVCPKPDTDKQSKEADNIFLFYCTVLFT